MSRKIVLCFGLVGLIGTVNVAKAENLFRYGTKDYSEKELDPASKIRLHEAMQELYRAKERIIETAVVDFYLADLAAKDKKTADQVRAEKLDVSEPTEADLKKFYEENKGKIPYPYDQIKDRLGQFVKDNNKNKKFEELIAEIKKSGNFKSYSVEPLAPKVELTTVGFPSKGNPSSKVTVVEFADYKCPHCREAYKIMKEIVEKNKDKINFVFVDFPIIHDSEKIAVASHCAKDQGKYWEFHNLAYEKQGELKEPDQFVGELKLDSGKFKTCMDGKAGKDIVAKGKAEGERVGVSGTPTIFINGFKYNLGIDKEAISNAIEEAISGKKYAS